MITTTGKPCWPDWSACNISGIPTTSTSYKLDYKLDADYLVNGSVKIDSPINRILEKVLRLSMQLPIKKVIFNKPATIVIWNDGIKTVVKCGEKDEYDEEKGLAMAIVKRLCGNKGRYNEEFKKWIPERQTKQQSAKEKLMQAADEYVKSVMGDIDGQ